MIKAYLKKRVIYTALSVFWFFGIVGQPAAVTAQALKENCSEGRLRNLGVLIINCEGDTPSACYDPFFGPRFPQGVDGAALTQSIQDYIKNTKPASPLADHATEFVEFGQQYNVNPGLVVAIGQKETQLATVSIGLPPQYNIFAIRNTDAGSFGNYPSIRDAIEAVNKLLSGHLYLGPPSNFTTFLQIMNRYAPKSDGNDPEGYANFIQDVVQKILGPLKSASIPDTAGSGCAGLIGGQFNFGPYANLTRTELIKRLYDSGHWKPLKSYDEDNDGIPDATEDVNNGVARDNLLRLLVAAVETLDIDIYPSVIKTGHSACSPRTGHLYDHMYGVAIDLTEAGGENLTNTLATWFYQNRAALGVDELIYLPMPNGTFTLENGQKATFSSETLAVHDNHVHVSIDRVITDPC